MSDLFSPCEISGLQLNNRLVMAPMTRSRSPNRIPGPDVGDYYARRIKGGVGLIITEGTAIDRPGAVDDPNVPDFHGPEALAGWKNVVAKAHAAGGKIAPQLWHVGAFAGPRAAWEADDQRIESPSGLRGPADAFGRAMTEADIADTIVAYASAAENAVQLGFDAIEIHGAHGYLIDQYFWRESNNRKDDFGGESITERSRFGVEIVKAVRAVIPKDFPLLFRFSQFKQQDYSAKLAQNPEELGELLQPLADAGVSVFHASQRRFWDPEFVGSTLNLAGWSKKVTGLPAITVGSVGLSSDFIGNRMHREVSEPASLDNLIERLGKDEFDLVAVGRALLMDPEWANKMRDGRHSELKAFDVSALSEYY